MSPENEEKETIFFHIEEQIETDTLPHERARGRDTLLHGSTESGNALPDRRAKRRGKS